MNKKPDKKPVYLIRSCAGRIGVPTNSSDGVDEITVDVEVRAFTELDYVGGPVASFGMKVKIFVKDLQNNWVEASNDQLKGQLGQSTELFRLQKEATDRLHEAMRDRYFKFNLPSDEWSDDIFLAN